MTESESLSTIDAAIANAVAFGGDNGVIRALKILRSRAAQSEARIAALEASMPKRGTWVGAACQGWRCECNELGEDFSRPDELPFCESCGVYRPHPRPAIAEPESAAGPIHGLRLKTPVAPVAVPNPAPSKHSLMFIINGEETSQPVTPGMPMAAARNHGLVATGNTGRPPDEWEIREVSGVLVPPDVMAVSFPHETRLFCTLKVGGGGGARDERRCHVEVTGCTSVATHDLGPFGGSRRTIPACLSCVRAHDAEGTQYGRARAPREDSR
jgi:hypothetical protein